MRTSALFGAKKLQICQNLWCVRTDREREAEQCGHFEAKEGGGRFFAILFGRLL